MSQPLKFTDITHSVEVVRREPLSPEQERRLYAMMRQLERDLEAQLWARIVGHLPAQADMPEIKIDLRPRGIVNTDCIT